MKTITVIDTFAFFFRSYFALPPLKNPDGFPTGLLTGFINFIHRLQREHSTDYIVFALDSEGPTFRKKLYPEYKANRPTPPEELLKQLPIAIEWIEKMGLKTLSKDGYEADDVIATICRYAKRDGIEAKIVSSDKDLYQLLDDSRVYLYDWVKQKVIDENGCMEKFGIEPRYFVDFQALVGDSSDNVPGVPGIGTKTASKLIGEYHTLENLYENIESAGTPRIRKLLLENREKAFLSRELVRLRDDIYDSCPLASFEFEDTNYLSRIADELEKYDMKQALNWAKEDRHNSKIEDKSTNIPENGMDDTPLFEAILVDDEKMLENLIEKLTPETIVAFDTETTGLDTRRASLVGFSFAIDESKAYYVPVGHNYLGVGRQISEKRAFEAIEKIMKCRVVGQNLKFDLSLLYNLTDMEKTVPWADTMIMAWLLDPSSRVGLDALAKRYFGYTMKSFSEVVRKGGDFSEVQLEEASFYASEDAWMTLKLYHKLTELFSLSGIEHLLDEASRVEYPFINVLISMENRGIEIDTDHLKSLEKELGDELKRLTASIYESTGTEFNIKSTKQLGEILFGKLGLKGGKKTKTGYSTNEQVLKSLAGEHPVIEMILEYREKQKILSTYIKPLLKLSSADPRKRVHTTFLQTGTATGRLSSKDPNLQNIPVRTRLGRRVRKAFVAQRGYTLVSIDYSQIELRLLAHFSGDKALLEAFEQGQDIHMATAIKLFGEENAKEKRNFAKSINFGLLYGMGPRKLSAELGISSKEAKEIIEAYFSAFPTVKRYISELEERAKREGVAETLLGRRRVFDYENATPVMKAAILREAVNTVFQGSAADLIKLAMLEIEKSIASENLNVNLLLQIHDELIFEAKREDASEYADRFREMMENIYPLDTRLVCSVSIGDSWDTLK